MSEGFAEQSRWVAQSADVQINERPNAPQSSLYITVCKAYHFALKI